MSFLSHDSPMSLSLFRVLVYDMQMPSLLSRSMHLFLAPPNLNTREFLYLCADMFCERVVRIVQPAIAMVLNFLLEVVFLCSETAAPALRNMRNVGATLLHSESTLSHLKSFRSAGVVRWSTEDPSLVMARHSFWTIPSTAATATFWSPGTLMTAFGM